MKLFKGKNYRYGIHAPDRKCATCDLPIERLPLQEKVCICLSQHIGAPAECIVSKGDKVVKGQLIGRANGPVSANVYSSVCGVVEEIKDLINRLGQIQKHVIIKVDAEDESELLLPPLEDFSATSIIERVREAGIVGLGGAGFPTAIKLTPKNQLDYLIINGAECEPYLTCDYRLMLERSEEIYQGILLTAKALGVEKIIMGIEANKPKAIEIFSKFEKLDVCILKKQYPMGSEKHLIYVTTGKKVPTGKMPFDVGCAVQNIKTMIAIYQAVKCNKPLTQIVMTVSGNGITRPANLLVPTGTIFSDIANYLGGVSDETVKVVVGGPMMGKTIMGLNHFVRKTDSGLLFLTSKEASIIEPTNCINCAVCAKNCPMRLMPMYIESYSLSGDFKNAERYGAMNCIECGSCAYNCPAKRPLVQSIVHAKNKIREMKQNAKR